MKIEGTVYCEAPDCNAHQHVGVPTMNLRRLPVGWLCVTEYGTGRDRHLAYHSWDCLMKAAAQVPPPEIIPWGGESADGC